VEGPGRLAQAADREGENVTMTLGILLCLLMIFLLLSSFYSGTEMAFFSLSRFQISKMEEERRRNAGLVRDLMRRPDLLLNGILLGNLLVNVLLTATATLLSYLILTARGFNESLLFLVDILGVSFLLLIFGEVTPKVYAIDHAERLALRIAPWIQYWIILTRPLLKAMTGISLFLRKLFYSEKADEIHTSEELRTLLDVSARGGDIEHDTRDIISSIFYFGETVVKEIMTPRIDIMGVDIDTDIAELHRIAQESRFSRMPAYRGSLDQIVGLVYAKDLLKHICLEGKGGKVSDLVKEAFFVPEAKPISDLLKELQRERIHMAIVVDEYGGTAGLVTLEDILEEIVGDIQDEYDVDEQMYRKLDENAYLVDGKLDVDDLSELIGTEIKGKGFETVGGLIFQALGRIPHQGEEVVVDHVRFIVSKIIGRRIVRVKVIRVEEDASEQGEE